MKNIFQTLLIIILLILAIPSVVIGFLFEIFAIGFIGGRDMFDKVDNFLDEDKNETK